MARLALAGGLGIMWFMIDNERAAVSTSARKARHQGPRRAARWLLGGVLIFAGTGHLTFARQAFQAQVPAWIPIDPDTVVLASGVVEIALGATLALAPARHRQLIGTGAALFFIAVLPGNIAQYTEHRDAFGLDTDTKRAVRLLFQPLLVAWAWWSTRTSAGKK